MANEKWLITTDRKICDVCGREIPSASSRTKYCSDECARAAHLNQFRKYNREADGKPVEEDAPKRITPKEYGEIMRRLGYIDGVSFALPQSVQGTVSDFINDITKILEKYRW